MKITLSIICTMLALLSFGQNNKLNAIDHKLIGIETDKIYDKLVKIRRDFHTNPELAGKEKRSQQVIKDYLLNLGIEVDTTIYAHSIVGIIQGGRKGTKKIAWRADMDALPSDFPEQLSFKSKVPGVQHGCGHDVHLAIGLGIAEILAKHKKSLTGTAYLIFQPEEETFVGAKNMISNGLLSKFAPSEIYAMHVTALPVGQIMVKPHEMFAYQKLLRIKLKNSVTNEEAKALAGKIYESLSRATNNSKPWEVQNMSDPRDGLMQPNTIFSDYLIMDKNFRVYSKNEQLFLDTYLYETNQAQLEKIIPAIEQVVKKENHTAQLVSVSFIQGNPTIYNDENLTKKSMKILQGIYGEHSIVRSYGQVPFFNDDFAYFQQKVPGVYFFLGGSNLEKGSVAMNHAANFMVDEESIKIGVKSFSSLIMERLNGK
ncbi:M20 metallopeptidase family protein [Pedobacter polysacchareus]|uniref:M20 metallopeptidase family protein n=1 Tax=Pedobacter polysacchareus TaxID=2861973 RepID=UPI001C99A78E|nr:M20/M25/M40 family metallo-hydrolase [Pedobacter polysacchareus]